jgi:acetyl-CoA carboxylase carboxyltransferase component
MIDDVIDPAETRLVICSALDAAETNHRERP